MNTGDVQITAASSVDTCAIRVFSLLNLSLALLPGAGGGGALMATERSRTVTGEKVLAAV